MSNLHTVLLCWAFYCFGFFVTGLHALFYNYKIHLFTSLVHKTRLAILWIRVEKLNQKADHSLLFYFSGLPSQYSFNWPIEYFSEPAADNKKTCILLKFNVWPIFITCLSCEYNYRKHLTQQANYLFTHIYKLDAVSTLVLSRVSDTQIHTACVCR